MRLLHSKSTLIPENKITGYHLNYDHADGGSKHTFSEVSVLIITILQTLQEHYYLLQKQEKFKKQSKILLE